MTVPPVPDLCPTSVVSLVTPGHGAHNPTAVPARSIGRRFGGAVPAHGRHSAPYQPDQFASRLSQPPQAGPGTAENSLYASLPTLGQTRASSLPGSSARGRGNHNRTRGRPGSQKPPMANTCRTTQPAPAPPRNPLPGPEMAAPAGRGATLAGARGVPRVEEGSGRGEGAAVPGTWQGRATLTCRSRGAPRRPRLRHLPPAGGPHRLGSALRSAPRRPAAAAQAHCPSGGT